MGILSKILGVVPAAEREGIHLADSNPQRAAPTTDPIKFLRALPRLGLAHATLYIEGTADSAVEKFLEHSCITPNVRVAIGTIWPRPKVWHLPLTEKLIDGLSQILEQRKVPYFCTHIHVYSHDTILLEWHDAFGDDPILLSSELKAEQIQGFATALGISVSNG